VGGEAWPTLWGHVDGMGPLRGVVLWVWHDVGRLEHRGLAGGGGGGGGGGASSVVAPGRWAPEAPARRGRRGGG